MDLFTNGELKPVEDPPMLLPDILPEEEQPQSASEQEKMRNANQTEQRKNEVDEFNDPDGIHYKPGQKITSKTPGPDMIV